MMKALFFVYTPFQFLVAQLIVRQEGFKESVLVEGYVGNNKHFLEIYRILKIDSLWGKTYVLPELPSWDGLVIRNLQDVKKAYSNYKWLKGIAGDNQIDTFFLGENKNQSIRFSAKVFSHLGYKIAYYEEGLAHYIKEDYRSNNSFSFKLKVLLRDLTYYLPLYHVRFAKWRYQPGKALDENFPMDARYSMLPVFYGEKEHIVKPHIEFSDKLKRYIDSCVDDTNGLHQVLLLTQPLDEAYGVIENFEEIYINVIAKALETLPSDVTVYVKFHPRDNAVFRKNLLEKLKATKIKTVVLSEDINLPVEIYLQYMTFEKIFFFFSSTYAYNGYLFPKQEFVSLLPKLNEECVKAAGHEFDFYKRIISLFDLISNLSTNKA